MEPILKTIACAYAQRYTDLSRCCFLFPNKRCGVFLKSYLQEYGKKSEEMPRIFTISEFVTIVSGLREAGRIVQLFTLFNAYKEVVGEEGALDFDTFRGWGEFVLSDFNTIDQYLVDSDKIFKNVKDFRSIATNFLTDEQKEVMQEYFGVYDFNDTSSFWKNFDDQKKLSELKKRFLHLWRILAPLHEKFIEYLISRGEAPIGYIYRRAAEKISERGKNALLFNKKRKIPYDKIVIVGFNGLSEAERSIFKDLKKEEGIVGYDDFADFIWDMDGPILSNSEFSASRFVRYNSKLFPSPEWLQPILEEDKVIGYPEVSILSAPSLTSQPKVAANILSNLQTSIQNSKLPTTALVLPDESLLSNTLFSLPDGIGEINLTMGYSFRNTPITAFMALLRRLYMGSRRNNKGILFYTKDLKMFFSHPYSYILFPADGIQSLLTYITRLHKVSLSLHEISEHLPDAQKFLDFNPRPSSAKNSKLTSTASTTSLFHLLLNIFQSLLNILGRNLKPEENNEDYSQVRIYLEYLEDFRKALDEFNILSSPLSILHMIDRLVSTEKIGFEGEPLSGLQVMGTLETRSLDFRNVIIMSMNEGIMPRKAIMSTFIPESLRKSYGLPPARYTEEFFSYYFYRLISRAEKVFLIFNGNTASGMKGAESRYILQIREYFPKDKVSEVHWHYRLQNHQPENASIVKSPEILTKTEAFSINGPGRKNFSASSLNSYRECQVKFFLQNILNISSDPEPGDYMDAIVIGDVLHDVMMNLYMPKELQHKLLKSPIVITKEFLQGLLEEVEDESSGKDSPSEYSKTEILNPDSFPTIRNFVRKSILQIYYHHNDNSPLDIESGVIEIIEEQIVELVKEIIRADIKIAPFNLYGCEVSENIRVTLSSGRVVNFRFAIDRLDEVTIDGEPRLRIVDYKTGKRKRKASSLREVFEGGGYGSEQIFQLFTYAWLLGKIGMKGWEDVVTEIYYVPDLIKGESGYPEIANEKVTSFRPFIEEFSERIESLIETIFESPKFYECLDSNTCHYCTFRSFCRK